MKISLRRTGRILSSSLLCILGLALLSGMGGKPVSPEDMVTVSRVSIRDRQVLQKNLPLVVTFSAPMVSADKLDTPVQIRDMPFAVHPAVPGEGRWLTENSFAFTATDGYPRGKDFFVVFKEDLQSADGKPVRYFFAFSTEPTTVHGVWPGNYDSAKHTFRVELGFSLPVTVKALREHIAIKDPDTGEALPVSVKDVRGETRYHTVLVDLGQYRPHLNLNLRTDEPADADPMGMAEAYSVKLAIAAEAAPSQASGSARPVAQVQGSDKSQPSPLAFREPYSYDEEGAMTAYFYLTGTLAAQDQKEFIKVTPDLPYTLDGSDSVLLFQQGVEAGMQITVTLKPGLVDGQGRELKEERTQTMTVRDRNPAVRFAEPGSLLTPAYGSRIGISLVNVDQINVSMRRQYDNNMPFMALVPEYRAEGMMRHLGYRDISVKGKKNEMLRRAIDLAEFTKGERGVFLVRIVGKQERTRSNGSTYMSTVNAEERLVIFSDIGITARAFPAGITVFASGISTGKPLPNADVRVYSESNQLVAQGKTGPDGVLAIARSAVWDEQLKPNVVTVSTGNDLSFLALEYRTNIELPETSSRDYLDKGYEAFVYTPRGVFRPGETVDLKAFVRDARHMPPAPFPVVFSVTSSRGIEMTRGSVTLSDQGGADFAFTLPNSAPTGEYTAQLQIPGKEGAALGQVAFSVEDFVPPRLEVTVAPKEENMLEDAALPVALSGQYLFGAPGADLAYELGYKAVPRLFSPKGWDGYVFGNMEREFTTQVNLRYLTGKLQEDGKAEVDFKAPPDWLPPSVLQVLLIGGVQEDGGRWVTQTNTVTYFPTPYLLGMKVEDGSLIPGKLGHIQVAAVDPAGKAVAAGKLDVEISLIQGNWHTVYRNGRYVYTWSEQIIPQAKFAVETKDGQGAIPFKPERYGRYLVRCAAADGKIVAARRVSAWAAGGASAEEGTGRMDTVELSFDKKEYLAGETAKLSVKAPYAGTLLLGIERGVQLSTRVIAMDKPAMVVEVPVTADMDPNAIVTAWVYRPVRQENKEWYAHRAHGRASLLMSKVPHRLEVQPTAPERAEPSKALAIPFTVVDEHGSPVQGEFSVALVDEGILSLTAFKTPDPLSFFMEERRSVGNSYDAFDALLRPEAKATTLLKPGGDGAEDYQGSLSTQQIFLTAYLPTVRTDAEGKGEAFFDIPEYSGKGRLMIVGASGARFASAAAPVRFARDVVVEATAPRAVAPGDVFDIPLKVFTLENAANPLTGKINVKVSAVGPLALSGDVDKALEIGTENAKGAKTRALTVRGTAQKASGVATIAVDVSVPGRDDLTFTKYVDVVVRPPYPRTSTVKSALIEGGRTESLALPGKWLAGSVKTSLAVDSSPVLSVLPALEYLREYPYGCLEQTTSRAWPYLTLTTVQKALYPDEDADANTKAVLNQLVARISSMQTAEGGFSMWPGYSHPDPWRSVNAAFFLVEAKSQVPVSKSTLSGALGYLRFLLAVPANALGHGSEYAYSTKAYAAFVLTRAGEAPLGWIQSLSEHEKEMWPSGRIFLAAAKALKAGNPNALRALQEKTLQIDPQKLEYNESMESTLRNQSLRLLAWSLVAPSEPEALNLCKEVAERISSSRYLTTQEAGMAALALGTFLEKTGGGGKDYSAEIVAAGKTVAKAAGGQRLVLSADMLPLTKDGGPEPLTVKVEGKDRAYCVYTVRGVPFEAPAPASNDLTVERVWKDADGKVIPLNKGPVKLKQGDRITVELILKPGRKVSNLVISDLLPGGMEVENPRLKTAAAAADESGDADAERAGREDREISNGDPGEGSMEEDEENGESSGSGASAIDSNGMYLDLREDRLLVFFDRLSDQKTYRYSMRAVSKGTFVLPPLAAEGMYAPEINALTASGVLVVE